VMPREDRRSAALEEGPGMLLLADACRRATWRCG
jgi:hypothetical protein